VARSKKGKRPARGGRGVHGPSRGAPVGCLAIVLATALPAAAQGPEGGIVVRGQASISGDANRTTVRQASNRAVIDWRRFDVGADHHVAFEQPGTQAATLNRVLAGRESTIAGRITAPGTVIVQNTAGVVFQGSARVDVGSLVATSQRVDVDRFQATGTLAIGGGEVPGARVVNDGTVTVAEAGLAALVGSDVANSGVIVARQGTIALASGSATTIDLAGDGLARIVVDGAVETGVGGVVNSGTLDAAGGRVLLTAGAAAAVLDGAINTTGLIRAASAEGQGGTVELIGRGGTGVVVDGTIDASGTTGGAVTATGATVHLTADARVAAAGIEAGGSVRIGGNRLGAPPLRRADAVRVAEGAVVDAGSSAGAGGSVVVWSDVTTQVDGRIVASGATAGGFVETSSAGALGIGEMADVAPGAGGEWLLDPRDIVIRTTGGPVSPVPPGTTPYFVNRGPIQTALDAGTDVTVATIRPGSTMPGDITVEASLDWTGSGTLWLVADRDVLVRSSVRTRGDGDFLVDATRDIVVDGNIRADATADVTLTAAAGDVIMSNSRSGNRSVFTTDGNVTMAAPTGSVLLRRGPGNNNNIQVYSVRGDVDLSAGTEIRLEGGNRGGTWVRVGRAGNAADVRLTAPVVTVQGGPLGDSFAEVVTGAGGSITITATDRITVQNDAGAPGSPARIQARDGASLALSAPVQTWNGLVEAGPAGAGGTVDLAGAITATVAPSFRLAADRDFTLAAATAGGAPSSYDSPLALAVTTSGTGRVAVDAPIAADRVTLVAEEAVALGAGGTLTAAGPVDAIVVAAGRNFANGAGASALVTTDPGARWLVYVDTFAGVTGAEPGPRAFDLYGRSFAAAGPATLVGLGGNRLVFAETPVLTLRGNDATKTTARRPRLASLRAGCVPATTLTPPWPRGRPRPAPAAPPTPRPGTYGVDVAALASLQGYALDLQSGTLVVDPAALSVTADDARRTRGAADPVFDATFAGFRTRRGPVGPGRQPRLRDDGDGRVFAWHLRAGAVRPDLVELRAELRTRHADGRPGDLDGDGERRQPDPRRGGPGLRRHVRRLRTRRGPVGPRRQPRLRDAGHGGVVARHPTRWCRPA
jgi:filamentous hemagglutinin family protein